MIPFVSTSSIQCLDRSMTGNHSSAHQPFSYSSLHMCISPGLFENVPLIITIPGKKEPEISNRLIQTGIDLIPTLCDYAGIAIPAGLRGLSAGKQDKEKLGELSRTFVISSVKPVHGSPVNGVKPDPDGRMVKVEHFKYWIYSQGIQRESLFDSQNDPGEMINLATDPGYKSVLQEYRKHLEAWCEKYNDSFAKYLIR